MQCLHIPPLPMHMHTLLLKMNIIRVPSEVLEYMTNRFVLNIDIAMLRQVCKYLRDAIPQPKKPPFLVGYNDILVAFTPTTHYKRIFLRVRDRQPDGTLLAIRIQSNIAYDIDNNQRIYTPNLNALTASTTFITLQKNKYGTYTHKHDHYLLWDDTCIVARRCAKL